MSREAVQHDPPTALHTCAICHGTDHPCYACHSCARPICPLCLTNHSAACWDAPDAPPNHTCTPCGKTDPATVYCEMCDEYRCPTCMPDHLRLTHRPLNPAVDTASPHHRPAITKPPPGPFYPTDEVCRHCSRSGRQASICLNCGDYYCPTCLHCHVCQVPYAWPLLDTAFQPPTHPTRHNIGPPIC